MRTAHEPSNGIGTLALSCSALAADTNRKDTSYLQRSAEGLMADVEDNGKSMKSAADPDVMQFAGAEYQTVPGSRKEIDAIHSQPGK